MAGPAAGPNGPQIFIDDSAAARCPRRVRSGRFASIPIRSRRNSTARDRTYQIFTKPARTAYHAADFSFGRPRSGYAAILLWWDRIPPITTSSMRRLSATAGQETVVVSSRSRTALQHIAADQRRDAGTRLPTFCAYCLHFHFRQAPSQNWMLNPRHRFTRFNRTTRWICVIRQHGSQRKRCGRYALPTQEVFGNTRTTLYRPPRRCDRDEVGHEIHVPGSTTEIESERGFQPGARP